MTRLALLLSSEIGGVFDSDEVTHCRFMVFERLVLRMSFGVKSQCESWASVLSCVT